MNNIPKIYFLFWDGSRMSYLQTLTITTFHKLNPDWAIVVYLFKQNHTELGANTFVPEYTGEDCWQLIGGLNYIQFKTLDLNDYGIDKATHGIQVSDRLRIQKLYEHGGMYSDFDVLWLKPMSEFKNVSCIGNIDDFEATASFYNQTEGFHSISNFLAEPKSGYLLSILREQKRKRPPFKHQAFGAEIFNKLYPTRDDILNQFPRVLLLKYETFFPYDLCNLESLYKTTDLSVLDNKNVMCIHWFNGHELSKEYVNEGGYEIPCSMTSILERGHFI